MTIAMKASQYAVVAVALLTANSYSPVKAQVILEMSALTPQLSGGAARAAEFDGCLDERLFQRGAQHADG